MISNVQISNLILNRKNRNGQIRCGFSLLELMFVLAILLVVASLSVPTIQRTFSRHALNKGAGLLRASMGQARIKAIKTGEVFALYYVPGEAWHGIAPFANAQEQMSIATRRARDSQNRSGIEDFSDDLLPRGVIFSQGEAIIDARAAQAVEDAGQGAMGNVKMILFYPDGTSQDAQVILENDKREQMQVTLRGLTGTSTTTKLKERNR